MLLLLALRSNSKTTSASTELRELLSLSGVDESTTSSMKTEELFARAKESIGRLRLDLNEAKNRERAVIEKAVDVICIIDINSKFVTVSKACKHAWGYEPAELEKSPLADILVSENADSILGSILGSANSIDKIVFECQLRRKNGEVIDVVWTGHWSASDGGLFCIVHDITERKRAEKLVKNNEIRLQLTLEGLPAGVLISQSGGKIEFANSEASRLLGFGSGELEALQMEKAIANRQFANNEELSPQSAYAAARVKATGRRKDGSEFPVEISESKIDLAGEQKSIAVFLDKTAEEELLKREFKAMITHDLKTPLTAIHGIIALLEEGMLGDLNNQGREMIGRMRVTCKRLLRLINDLLDLEKIDSGKFGLECKSVNAHKLVDHSLENVRGLAEERKIEFQLSVNDVNCWGDEDRLVQVLVNLLSNAIKYSPDESKIEITASLEDDDSQYVRFSIADHGRGIPADKIEKVFGKFEQVEIADSKLRGGTGLGLAICKAIVKEHDGNIGVTSVMGGAAGTNGSTFWFSIPTPTPTLKN